MNTYAVSDGKIVYSKSKYGFELLHKEEKELYTMPPHTHNAIEIFYTLTEIPGMLLESKIIEVPKNSLIVIPAGCVHKICAPEELVINRYILSISSEWFIHIFSSGDEEENLVREYTHPLLSVLSEKQTSAFTELLNNLLYCNYEDIFRKTELFCSCMDFIHKNVIHKPMVQSETYMHSLSKTAQTVSDAVEYIYDHLYEDISLEEISEHIHLHQDYVSRIFKKYMNTSIKQFVIMQRIAKAQQLLKEGKTISEVSEITGYNSYEHFSRAFKKVTGMSPGEFQNRPL